MEGQERGTVRGGLDFLNLDAQILTYSNCCYLGKRKSRTIVEEKCNRDIYLDSINIILGLVITYKFVWSPAIPQLLPLLHCPPIGSRYPPLAPMVGLSRLHCIIVGGHRVFATQNRTDQGWHICVIIDTYPYLMKLRPIWVQEQTERIFS